MESGLFSPAPVASMLSFPLCSKTPEPREITPQAVPCGALAESDTSPSIVKSFPVWETATAFTVDCFDSLFAGEPAFTVMEVPLPILPAVAPTATAVLTPKDVLLALPT